MKRDLRLCLPPTAPPAQVYGGTGTDVGRGRGWAECREERDGLVEPAWTDEGSLLAPALRRRAPASFAVRRFGRSGLQFAWRDDGVGGTGLDLVLPDLPDERWARERAGRPRRLLELKAACEFGVDLRRHDPACSRQTSDADG